MEFVDGVCRFLADFFWVAGDAGDAAFHGSIGDGCGDDRSDAFVEGVGDDVVFGQFVIADQGGDGVRRSQFHVFVDAACPDGQGAAEDAREDHDVIDLIRCVRPASADDFGTGRFDAVRGNRPGVPTKPDPTGLYALMAELGADSAATLFVGDSDVDILTGHNAQLPAMGALWGFRGRAELTAAGADALAEVPEDILRYVQEQNK